MHIQEKLLQLKAILTGWSANPVSDPNDDHLKLRQTLTDLLHHIAERIEEVAKGAIPSNLRGVLDGIGLQFESFLRRAEERLNAETVELRSTVADLEQRLRRIEQHVLERTTSPAEPPVGGQPDETTTTAIGQLKPAAGPDGAPVPTMPGAVEDFGKTGTASE